MKIAAIIPLYNGARFIEQALESVLAQTTPPAEIIVVDDGSTDDGAAIVERMAAAAPITLLRKENGGQSSARNLGIAHSSATHIALLDQDDMWYPTHLEDLAKPFQRSRVDNLGWVYGNLDEVDEQGQMVVRSVLRILPFHHPKRDLFACLANDMFVLPSASLIARSAFDAVGGFDERLSGYEDDDLFLRLFRAGFNNVFLDRAVTKWRIHQSGTSWSPRMSRSRMIYLRKLLDAFPDNPDRDRYIGRDYLAPRFLPAAVGDYKKALQRGESGQITVMWQNLRQVARLHRFTVRTLFAIGAPLLGLPPVAKILLPAMTKMTPLARWLLRAPRLAPRTTGTRA